MLYVGTCELECVRYAVSAKRTTDKRCAQGVSVCCKTMELIIVAAMLWEGQNSLVADKEAVDIHPLT